MLLLVLILIGLSQVNGECYQISPVFLYVEVLVVYFVLGFLVLRSILHEIHHLNADLIVETVEFFYFFGKSVFEGFWLDQIFVQSMGTHSWYLNLDFQHQIIDSFEQHKNGSEFLVQSLGLEMPHFLDEHQKDLVFGSLLKQKVNFGQILIFLLLDLFVKFQKFLTKVALVIYAIETQ